MKYIETALGTPIKVVEQDVPNPIRVSNDGHIILTEEREIHITAEELRKSIKSLNNKLGYLRFQISERYIQSIQRQIDEINKKKTMFENFLEDKNGK